MTMCNFNNITVNAGGIPLLVSSNVTVGSDSVDIALGFRRVQPIGLMLVRMDSQIPTGTTGTLPITITLNGTTRNLNLPNGTQATVSDLEAVSVFEVYNDRFSGILALMSRTTV